MISAPSTLQRSYSSTGTLPSSVLAVIPSPGFPGPAEGGLLAEEQRISKAHLENPEADGKGFEETAMALSNIVKGKLYLSCGAGTQAEYARNRWGLASGRLAQLLGCAPVLAALAKFARRPDSEKVCRALAQCRKDEAGWIELWTRVLDAPNNARISPGLVMGVHSAEREPGSEWVVQEEVVREVEGFLGEISLDPVWHPQSPVGFESEVIG
jgi:hypothetical protein